MSRKQSRASSAALKVIVTIVVLLLVATAIIAILTKGFTSFDVKKNFAKDPDQSQSDVVTQNLKKLSIFYKATSRTGGRFTVTDNHPVNWDVEFADPESEWAKNRDVADYVEMKEDQNGLTLNRKQSFKGQIIVTAVSKINPLMWDFIAINCAGDYGIWGPGGFMTSFNADDSQDLYTEIALQATQQVGKYYTSTEITASFTLDLSNVFEKVVVPAVISKKYIQAADQAAFTTRFEPLSAQLSNQGFGSIMTGRLDRAFPIEMYSVFSSSMGDNGCFFKPRGADDDLKTAWLNFIFGDADISAILEDKDSYNVVARVVNAALEKCVKTSEDPEIWTDKSPAVAPSEGLFFSAQLKYRNTSTERFYHKIFIEEKYLMPLEV